MTTRIWLIINLCLLSWIHCWHGSGAFSTASTTAKKSRLGRYSRSHLHAIKAIFSDIDGSLLHYPKDDDTKTTSSDDDEYQILKLPPSATGMRGIISATTLRRCRDIRRWGVKLVLISGMRTSTMLNRLSHLPKADAYCTESGGRIFYPIEPPPEFEKNDMEVEADSDSPFPFRQATPLQYDGANPEDLTSFGLVEDMVWRQRMEDLKAAGKDGYPGNEVSSNRCDNIRDEDEYEECLIDYENMLGFPLEEDVIPVRDRKGYLWEFARHLQDEHGLILDTTSYSTCFRINKKHQSTPDHFDALMQGDIAIPSGLNVSTNLGCVDIYPISSGKRNCCEYLADQWHVNMGQESMCICDDDNDMEMALACNHAFIPALTSGSVDDAARKNPDKFTRTFQPGKIASTRATDAALEKILEQVNVQ